MLHSFHKIIIIIAITILQNEISFAQNHKSDSIILEQEFRILVGEKPIIYIDSFKSNSYLKNELENLFIHDTIKDKRLGNSIHLSKSEQQYLISEIGKEIDWPDNLFPNSKRISIDSMSKYWYQRNFETYEQIQNAISIKDTTALKNLKYDLNYVFVFNQPIYIKENSFCFITYYALCGSTCGHLKSSIYKKTNENWVKWITNNWGDF